MKSKELTKLYEKAKFEYLAGIQNDDYSFTCKGCGHDFMNITIHHVIKQSKLKYFYADKRNFVPLCLECHHFAEGTVQMQMTLKCYDEMIETYWKLLNEYKGLSLSEQMLNFKHG